MASCRQEDSALSKQYMTLDKDYCEGKQLARPR